MPRRIDEPVPLGAVRDLLGIVRALWGVAEKRGEHHRTRILERAGRALKAAMKLASESQPGTPAHVRAHDLTDHAIELIAEALPFAQSLESVLSVAKDRAQGEPVRRTDDMQKRLNRVKRG